MLKQVEPGTCAFVCYDGSGRSGTVMAVEAVICRLFSGSPAIVRNCYLLSFQWQKPARKFRVPETFGRVTSLAATEKTADT
ncbi:hypothetical protein L596_026937 [Steinernema carpocapsae]|uniref:Uncharacterized protein n=1 Tax=Steinernema carpocapsae TaxID=34508 RepID=A0A4U5M2U3_STECR|nr:hypothetical protein L596_026937 [Steinernema carpocapsae]